MFACVADFNEVSACKLNVAAGSCELRFEKVEMPPTDKFGNLIKDTTSKKNMPLAGAKDDTGDKENSHFANDSNMTPITQWNLRWKSKVGGGLLTDSISSIRNMSLTNSTSANVQTSQLTCSPSSKKALVRQTSTPMQRDIIQDGERTGIMSGVANRRHANSFESINSSEQISSISPNVTGGSECCSVDSQNR